jgi:soluble lytic murein transglycosylase-like protein
MRGLCLLVVWSAAAQSPDAMRAAMEQQRAAAATQRQAVQQQAEMARHARGREPLLPIASELLNPSCPAIPDATLQPILEGAAREQDVPLNLLRAVVRQESAFKPCAVSSKGAMGLMQLMPATAEQFSVADPFDP